MKRDFTMSENTQESTETIEREVAERRKESYSYAFVHAVDPHMDEEIGQRVFAPISEQVRQRGTETKFELSEGCLRVADYDSLKDRLREKLAAAGIAQIIEPFKAPDEKSPPSGSSSRPEVENMLEKILAVGGSQIVDRLKEYAAKIEAADCTQHEIGSWVNAHYVPLLLSALALDDEDFDAEYPGERSVSAEEREALAEAIQAHAGDCPRCALKVASDNEWDEYVNGVFGNASAAD